MNFQLVFVFILAGVGGAMNSMLGGVKYWLGKKMHCESLTLEGKAFLRTKHSFKFLLLYVDTKN